MDIERGVVDRPSSSSAERNNEKLEQPPFLKCAESRLYIFGFCCVLFGYLIYKSDYLPGVLGVLSVIAGVGYVTFGLVQMLAPAFAIRFLFPWIMLPAFPAELGFCLWLLVKRVNLPKWEEKTGELQGGAA